MKDASGKSTLDYNAGGNVDAVPEEGQTRGPSR